MLCDRNTSEHPCLQNDAVMLTQTEPSPDRKSALKAACPGGSWRPPDDPMDDTRPRSKADAWNHQQVEQNSPKLTV